MCDCMMLILRVCLRFVESFGGDGIVTPFVRFPPNVGDWLLLSYGKYLTDQIHGRVFEIVVGCLNSSNKEVAVKDVATGEVVVMTRDASLLIATTVA